MGKIRKQNLNFKNHLRVNPFLATFINREDNEDAEICYGDDIGCFSNAWPYTSPGIFGRKGRLPESPDLVNATYFLSNTNCHECVIGRGPAKMKNCSHFD